MGKYRTASYSDVSSTQKVGAILGPKMWEQRLDVYARSSFTAVNLHDLWSKHPRRIWHVIGLVYKNGRGGPGPSPNSGDHGSHAPVETLS